MKIDFDVNKTEKLISQKMELAFRKVALDGMRKLIRESPVDTGRFKANWSTSIGVIDGTITDSEIVNLTAQTSGIHIYKLGQTMFLHNNLEYALSLEYGHSKQAAKGWIRATAILMQKKLDQIKDIL